MILIGAWVATQAPFHWCRACGRTSHGPTDAGRRGRPVESGLLADFFDVETIAEQTLAVLGDPAAYRHLGDRAVALIERDYSLEAVLPRMLELYQRTIAAGRKAEDRPP